MKRASRLVLTIWTVAVLAVAGTPTSAQALSSAQGLAVNTWIVSDLAASSLTVAAGTAATIGAAELAAAQFSTARTEPLTGMSVDAPDGTVLGAAWNTVSGMGAALLGFLPGGGQSLPTGTTGPTYAAGACPGSWFTGLFSGVTNCSVSPSTSSAFSFPITSKAPHATIAVVLETCGTDSLNTCNTIAASCGTGCNPPMAFNNMSRSSNTVTVWTLRGCSTGSCTTASPVVGTAYVPGRVSGSQSDPTNSTYSGSRYIKSTIKCRVPGGSLTTITANSSTFVATQGVTPTMPEAPAVECPAGTYLEQSEHGLHTDGTSTVVPLTDPYNAPSWVGTQATNYPECFPIGSTVCQLKVWKVSATPDLDCHGVTPGNNHPCLDWSLDPDRATKYECRFGASVLPFRHCQAYKETFRASTFQETPGVEETVLDAPAIDPTPEQTPGDTGCVPRFSVLLVPWWVYKATVCALKWAFIPTDLPPFGEIENPVPPGWVPAFPAQSTGACGVMMMPSLNFGPLLPATGAKQLVDTCEDPWPLVRTFTYYGLLASMLITIGHRATRAVANAAGMGVDSPSGGSDDD